jgi:Tfp pilus assembly protein PilN
MINLMPPELKTGYLYARRNVVLRKWIIVFLIALIGLGALATYGLLSFKQSMVHNNNQIAATETAFEKERSADTQKHVQDISNNFKLAVKVLSQEVLFSQLIKQIAATIPDNANLTGLTINQVQGGIDISANATDYKTATQVQVNLADPKNKIFSKADIVSITCGGDTGASATYPCTVNIRALFANNNPFLFINNKNAKS